MVEIIEEKEREREQKVSEGLDFVLNQVEGQSLFPRNIATKNTNNGQITVYSKAEAIQFYKDSKFIDCRISAYPYRYYNNNNNVLQLITFVLVDLDLKTFDWSNTKLDRYLFGKLLPNIKNQHDIQPSVVWSGNGYHVYIKIEPTTVALEQMDEFANYKEKEPSKEMLKFLERYFSGGKCDNAHNCTVSFTNMMLRIPGTINSKSNCEVVIKKKSNQKSFPIKLLLGDFLSLLIDKEQELELRKKYSLSQKHNSLSITWIEILLQTPLKDFRKYCIWRILGPYLINKRRLNDDMAYSIIDDWLDKCNELKLLDFDFETKINEGLNSALNKECYPIAFKDLKEECPELYRIIWEKIKLN